MVMQAFRVQDSCQYALILIELSDVDFSITPYYDHSLKLQSIRYV